MNTKDFYYDLPKELIAQVPLKNRASSKLMVLNRKEETYTHDIFENIINYLDEGDCLILNNTKVIPARLIGVKKDTLSKVEILMLRRFEIDDKIVNLQPLLEEYSINGKNIWECLVKPGKKAKIGSEIIFGNGELVAKVIDVTDEGNRIISFEHNGIFEEVLDKLGTMPLPPYITSSLEDKDRYQTVYAKYEGSAAAPTAGLHFTKELLNKIKRKGINIGFVTLHVGLGTFRPVKVDNIKEHKMHSEYYVVDKETAQLVNNTKLRGKRVVAVGTTSCRTLESSVIDGRLVSGSGDTDIFIYPGYKFNIIDALITNFHLPESTLMMLISAFSNKELVMSAYKEAIEKKYRFFSFGDAMLIE